MDIADVLNNYFIYKEQNIDTDEYQSALDIDLAVLSLLKNKRITEVEARAFYYLLCGYSFRKISMMLNYNRKIISLRLREIVGLVRDVYYADS